MVGKKIRNPHRSSPLGTRVRRLADYIDQPEIAPSDDIDPPDTAPSDARAAAGAAKAARIEGLADYAQRPMADARREKCIHGGARGFQSAARAAQKAEMLALAQASAHSRDPINHYVLSWQRGEQPTPAQVEDAVDLLLDELGLTDHQVLYGLHADTDNAHLHLMVNRVHPVTRKTVEINKGFDLEALHRAVARIERAQGWRREANGRYRVQADGTVERVRAGAAPAPDGGFAEGRHRQGDRRAGGAKFAERVAVGDGAPAIRAAASWADLHRRLAVLGMRYARQGSGALVWVGETAVKASRVGRACSLGALERRLGPYQAPPARLAVRARAPEADLPQTLRGAETRARRNAQTAEREALRAAHRSQRETLSHAVPPGGWRGRGAELNARRSLLAARQAADWAALLERQRRERALARWSEELPSDEDGSAAPAAGSGQRRARLVAWIALDDTLQPRDIRVFVAVVYGRRVDYRRADDPDGPAGFADRGREIAVYADRDRDAVRAALQLAAQKWGRFRVEGDAGYRALCVELAAEGGFSLGDPDLQDALRRAKAESAARAAPRPAADRRAGPSP